MTNNTIREEEGKIVLRSVFKIPSLNIEPSPDPKTGRFADHIKISVNDQFSLTEKERDSGKIYIGTHESIKISDGHTFNLDDPYDKAWWDAIKHSKFIARTRYMRNQDGQYVIDGGSRRYGAAEFYVEIPGKDSEIKVNKRKKINQAEAFVFDASKDDLYSKVRLLGNRMDNFTLSEVQEYLLKIAQKDPDKVIELFTGKDIATRMLILDAIEKRVIEFAGGKFYQYGNTILGVSQDAVLNFLKDPVNTKITGLLRKETYPHLFEEPVVEIAPKRNNPTINNSNPLDLGLEAVETVASKPATTSRAKK